MNSRNLVLIVAAAAVSACATPSAAERAEQARVATLMMSADAVHMPPAGVDSCVGVTVRLSDPSGKGEPERKQNADLIRGEEVEAALAATGGSRCVQAFQEAVEDSGLGEEPLSVPVAFGVDPRGKVCAIVERGRPAPIDPAAGPLVELAATCLKNALFAAQLPAGRVEGKARVVRYYTLVTPSESMPVQTSETSDGAAR